jgi:hypothetical protein
MPGPDEAEVQTQKWGHGTSVFSPPQYHVVLGIRAFGQAAPMVGDAGAIDAPVSLVDLAPTVADLLHIGSRETFDGQSLRPLLQAAGAGRPGFEDRVRFTESEYNPQGFSLGNFTRSALAAAAQVYRLDPRTDRITIREDRVDWIMSTRQYAALLDGAFAAAVPRHGGGGPYQFVYTPAPGNRDPHLEQRLRQALVDRFGISLDPAVPAH